MNRLLILAAAIALLLCSVLVVGARASGLRLPWQASVCGDPTAACWTQDGIAYTAVIRRQYHDTVPTAMSDKIVTARLLNTGPSIPHLVATLDWKHSGRVIWARATIATPGGSHTLTLRRVPVKTGAAGWDLGVIPDGDVVTFVVRCKPATTDISWMQAQFYGRLSGSGGPDLHYPVAFDRAALRS